MSGVWAIVLLAVGAGIGALLAYRFRPKDSPRLSPRQIMDLEIERVRATAPERRDPIWAEPSTNTIDGDEFEIEVAGESHRNNDGVDRQAIIAQLFEGNIVHCVREPKNAYDRNAIRVDSHLGTIGYVCRAQSEILAREIDGGAALTASIKLIAGGTPEKPSRGVWLTGRFR